MERDPMTPARPARWALDIVERTLVWIDGA